MLDIWKTIIEHVLSWPVAALFLGLLFRRPLTALIARISSIKAPGFDFSAPQPPASAQIEITASPTPDTLKGEIGSTTSDVAITPTATPSGVDTVLAEKREAVRAFGQGNAIVDESVVTIKKQLAALDMPLDSVDTGEILVRHLAATQLSVRCERTHRLIYGSQVLALHMMNGASQPETALNSIFENARAKEPQFYGSYTVEDWIGFLITEGAVIKTDDGQYGITVYGRIYLEYIGAFPSLPRPH